MTIRVNGGHRDVPEGTTVEGLLAAIGLDPAEPGVAVAVGDAVVPRSEWARRVLAEGDVVEIIHAVQGG